MRSDTLVIFTKAFETPRFNAVPGMLVPTRYRNTQSLKYFREKYGEDVVRIVPAGEFRMDAGAPDAEAVRLVSETNERQAQTIQKLEAEVATLKQRIRDTAVSNKSK